MPPVRRRSLAAALAKAEAAIAKLDSDVLATDASAIEPASSPTDVVNRDGDRDDLDVALATEIARSALNQAVASDLVDRADKPVTATVLVAPVLVKAPTAIMRPPSTAVDQSAVDEAAAPEIAPSVAACAAAEDAEQTTVKDAADLDPVPSSEAYAVVEDAGLDAEPPPAEDPDAEGSSLAPPCPPRAAPPPAEDPDARLAEAVTRAALRQAVLREQLETGQQALEAKRAERAERRQRRQAELGATANPVTTSMSVLSSAIPRLCMVVVGDSSVGKTSLLQRFVHGRFDESLRATVSVDLSTAQVTLDHQTVGVQLLDTAGQERFAPLTAPFYRQAEGILVAYDVGSRESLERALGYWAAQLERHAQPTVAVLLCGTKADLAATSASYRQVPAEEAAARAEGKGWLFCETSALSGARIGECFHLLTCAVMNVRLANDAKAVRPSGLGQPSRDSGILVQDRSTAAAPGGACAC